MIVAQRKKVPELVDILKGRRKILLLGCGTCVTVCLAGGEREVSINASALRIASRLQNLAFQVEELTIERQCDNVFIEKAAEAIKRNDVVLSLGCGAGVQVKSPASTLDAGTADAVKARAEEARLWITGLEAVHRKIGVKAVYDLSATPFYLKGSGYPEGTLFPWVVSDFSLMDAIESGIVKIPRVPVADIWEVNHWIMHRLRKRWGA